MNDADYLYAFQEVVMPIAYEFNPDLVIGNGVLLILREKLIV
jgi:acetoin utilization deacetylase AcuC-like enzyme